MWRAMKINELGKGINELIINDTAYLFVDGLLLAVCLPKVKPFVKRLILYRLDGYGYSTRQDRAFKKFCKGWETDNKERVAWDRLNDYVPVEPTE
jgi:hypothetical protein